MSDRDTKDFWRGVMIIALACLLLLAYFLTAPSQVFDDCGGVDVPAHCVD